MRILLEQTERESMTYADRLDLLLARAERIRRVQPRAFSLCEIWHSDANWPVKSLRLEHPINTTYIFIGISGAVVMHVNTLSMMEVEPRLFVHKQ